MTMYWLCFLSLPIIKTIKLKDVKLQWQQKYRFTNASDSSKIITQHEKTSPVEYDEIKIIGITPATNKMCSPIGRRI